MLRGTPPNPIINPLVILHPHLSQKFDRRNLTKPLGNRWIEQGIKQFSSLLSNLFGKSLTLGFSHRRTRIFTARPVALDPFWLAVRAEPFWSHHRKTIEGSTHRLPHAQHPVEGFKNY